MSNRTLVVTAWNNKLYEEYAHIFEETYNWDLDYIVYNEDEDLFDLCPDLKEFVDKHKTRHKVRDYSKDAVRFSYKVFAYCHAISTYTEDYDGIVWIDADSKFYKPIDQAWLNKHIIRRDKMITYMGRGKWPSECGFMYFNLHHPHIHDWVAAMKKMYTAGKLFDLRQQDDSYVFDVVRLRFQRHGVKNYDIGDEDWGHVQERSILGGVYDHMKGNRKYKKGSYENPLFEGHDEAKRFRWLGKQTGRRRV